MKNFIKLSLCALILFTATTSVWADQNLGKCVIYFDNSQWHWTSVKLHIWNGSSNSDMNFSKIDGSDYWMCDQNGWNNFTAYKFMGNDSHVSNELKDQLTSAWITRCFSGDNNQNWTLVGPKNVGITNTTTTQGGDGTEANPYVVLPGTKITVSATGDKIDDQTTVYYKFSTGTTDYRTTKTNTVVNSAVTGTTYSVKATVKTNRDIYNSREFDTQTLYYIAVDPCPSCKFINK